MAVAAGPWCRGLGGRAGGAWWCATAIALGDELEGERARPGGRRRSWELAAGFWIQGKPRGSPVREIEGAREPGVHASGRIEALESLWRRGAAVAVAACVGSWLDGYRNRPNRRVVWFGVISAFKAATCGLTLVVRALVEQVA